MIGRFARREAQKRREKRGFEAEIDEMNIVQKLKKLADELGIRGADRLSQAARARGMPSRGMLRSAKQALGQGFAQQV